MTNLKLPLSKPEEGQAVVIVEATMRVKKWKMDMKVSSDQCRKTVSIFASLRKIVEATVTTYMVHSVQLKLDLTTLDFLIILHLTRK